MSNKQRHLGSLILGLLKRIGLVISISVAVFGIAASLCQLSKECSVRAASILSPAWDRLEPFINGRNALSQAKNDYNKAFDAGIEAQQSGDVERACKAYQSANRALANLDALGARVDTDACRCSVEVHLLELCQSLGSSGADKQISDACGCERQVSQNTDCSSSCKASLDAIK
jgi:hypothetical protein